MGARKPLVMLGGNIAQLPAEDLIPLAAIESLGAAGLLRDHFDAGFTGAVSITGTAGLIPNDTSNPSATAGFTLFDRTLATHEGQEISVEISVPYMLMSTTGGVTLHAWANGEHIGTATSRVTTGAGSGNSMEPSFSFVAAGASTQIVIKIGVNNTAHTLQLFNRFGYASQPAMTVTRFGLLLSATGGQMSPLEVKSALLENEDTNVLTDEQLAKLEGVAPGATANSDDSFLLDRANHSGTQPSSTISGLAEAIKFNLVPALVVRRLDELGCVPASTADAAANTGLIQDAVEAGITLYIPRGHIYFINYLMLPPVFWICGPGTLAWAPSNRASPGNMFSAYGDIDAGVFDGPTLLGNRQYQTTLSTTGHELMAVSLRAGSIRNLRSTRLTVADFGDGTHGGGVILGSLVGTDKVVEDVTFDECNFRDINNVPGIYIDANSAYHSSLARVKVNRSRFLQNVPALQNQIYILGPSVTLPGIDVDIQRNWFEASQPIDCNTELNHIQGFDYSKNTNVLRGEGRATGLLIRDNCTDGEVDANRFFNFGSAVDITAISLTRLHSNGQNNIDLETNKIYNWGAGSAGAAISLGTGSALIGVRRNRIRSGPAGRIQAGVSASGSLEDISDNVFTNVNYPLVLAGTAQMDFERNKLIGCGDGAVGMVVGTAAGAAITNLKLKDNVVFSILAGTPNFASVSPAAATGNRIENNALPAGLLPCNPSYADKFTVVTPAASGALLAARVYRMDQGALGVGPGDRFIIGSNLDATLDGVGPAAIVPGDTVIVSPPGNMAGCIYREYVQATNRVRIVVENNSASAHDVPAGNWVITVIKTSAM